MADDLFTIADFAAAALDVEQTELSDIKNNATFTNILPIDDTSTGEQVHKYRKYTQEPDVGFRTENDGREYDHSVDEVVTVVTEILDFSWAVDQAVADAYPRGREQLIAMEGARHLAAALFKLEKQILNGTGALGDAAGFSGFPNQTQLASLGEMCLSGGSAAAGAVSSCYTVRVGRDDVKLVTPMSRGVNLGETTVIERQGTTGWYPAYYTPASLFIGCQMGGLYSVGRIANLDAANPLTDDLLAQSRSTFRAGYKPQYFVANSDVLEGLRGTRTATNVTGAPAPIIDNSFSMMAVETDGLFNTETVVA